MVVLGRVWTSENSQAYPGISHVGEAGDHRDPGSACSITSGPKKRLTLKIRDPYPNTTNGEAAIALVLFRVTVSEVGLTPYRYLYTLLLDP